MSMKVIETLDELAPYSVVWLPDKEFGHLKQHRRAEKIRPFAFILILLGNGTSLAAPMSSQIRRSSRESFPVSWFNLFAEEKESQLLWSYRMILAWRTIRKAAPQGLNVSGKLSFYAIQEIEHRLFLDRDRRRTRQEKQARGAKGSCN